LDGIILYSIGKSVDIRCKVSTEFDVFVFLFMMTSFDLHCCQPYFFDFSLHLYEAN